METSRTVIPTLPHRSTGTPQGSLARSFYCFLCYCPGAPPGGNVTPAHLHGHVDPQETYGATEGPTETSDEMRMPRNELGTVPKHRPENSLRRPATPTDCPGSRRRR